MTYDDSDHDHDGLRLLLQLRRLPSPSLDCQWQFGFVPDQSHGRRRPPAGSRAAGARQCPQPVPLAVQQRKIQTRTSLSMRQPEFHPSAVSSPSVTRFQVAGPGPLPGPVIGPGNILGPCRSTWPRSRVPGTVLTVPSQSDPVIPGIRVSEIRVWRGDQAGARAPGPDRTATVIWAAAVVHGPPAGTQSNPGRRHTRPAPPPPACPRRSP